MIRSQPNPEFQKQITLEIATNTIQSTKVCCIANGESTDCRKWTITETGMGVFERPLALPNYSSQFLDKL